MMCEACERDEHWLCGMQTWCECDCFGPDGDYSNWPLDIEMPATVHDGQQNVD